MDTLDIRSMREKGRALHTAIENAVGGTQKVLIRPLPSLLVMTRDQYNDLLLLSGQMIEMENSTDRIYMTKHNVMEVIVR